MPVLPVYGTAAEVRTTLVQPSKHCGPHLAANCVLLNGKQRQTGQLPGSQSTCTSVHNGHVCSSLCSKRNHALQLTVNGLPRAGVTSAADNSSELLVTCAAARKPGVPLVGGGNSLFAGTKQNRNMQGSGLRLCVCLWFVQVDRLASLGYPWSCC